MIKLIHIATVIISFALFLLRVYWKWQGSSRLQQRWVKIVPHVNDTILLLAGIMLALSIEQYPFVHGWLTAKVLALLAYIGFAMWTLKHARSRRQQWLFFVLAVLSYGYIVGTALTRLPDWPFA